MEQENKKDFHVEEYIKNNVGENAFRDLFEADEKNVTLRTEIDEHELDCINKIFIINEYLKNKIRGMDIYGEFLTNYQKCKVSYLRGSRKEFVDVNRKERFEQNLQRMNNFQTISKVKE